MRNIVFFLLPFALLLSACQPIRPIRELRIVETVGCDLAEDGVAVSVFAPAPELSLRQEAASLRLAMDRLRDKAASPALFFAHTEYLLIGQRMAAEALAPALDLVARSQDMRLRTPLWLVQGGDAADALQLGDNDRTVTQMLSALTEDMARQGPGHAFTCAEILQSLAVNGAALAAACTVGESSLKPYGYGVLKDGACVGWITAPEDRAVDLLMNLGGHGDVRLRGATLTIERSRAAFHPAWEGDRLAELTIEVRLRAALTETDGQPGVTLASDRAALEAALAGTAAGWCRGALQTCQALRSDALGIGSRLAEQDPGKWAAVRDRWDAVFPALPIHISVTASLDRTQDLEEPLALGGDA